MESYSVRQLKKCEWDEDLLFGAVKRDSVTGTQLVPTPGDYEWTRVQPVWSSFAVSKASLEHVAALVV